MARANNNGKHKGMSYTRYGYIFIAPFVIAYCIFSLYPLLTTFWYSTANMQSTTAAFWGFKNYEVYYDRYLDLTQYYSDNFEQEVGIKKAEYVKIRNFFSALEKADQYDPLNEAGVNAIIQNGANALISQSTIDELQQALNNQDMGCLSDKGASELKAWRDQYSDISLIISSKVATVATTVTNIANPETSDDEEAEETEAVTAETIINADSYDEFVASLTSEELTTEQQALINYLASKTSYATLTEYFNAVKNGEAAVEDPLFFYICTNLNKPNAVKADGTAVEPISVPFIRTAEEYLAANVWADMITSLNSYEKLSGYADGSIGLHEDEETLYADLEALHNAGIINIVQLKINGSDVSVSTDQKSEVNALTIYRTFIDTAYEANEVELNSAVQIAKITTYCEDQGRTLLVALGIPVDKYISYNGKFDVDKYLQFKQEIGLKDFLTYDKYKELDQARKDANVAAAQKKLEEAEAALPAAQAAYDALGKEDLTSKEYNALRKLELQITKAETTIKQPAGILEKVDARYVYIFNGITNYAEIFANKTRFNTVAGAFWNTALMWIIGFIPQILLALLLSAWFTDTKLHLKGLSVMKALMYLPNVITAVTIAIFFRRLFSYSSGGTLTASQQILHALGMEQGYNFFASAWATRLIVCFINFWMWYGNTMIVLIAGITSISESLYESAQIDGANSFQTYTKITMPLLRPIILYTLVTSLIGGLQMYDIPQNINVNPALVNFNGTMIKSIRTILIYINNQAFGKQDVKQVGIAAATSVLLFVVTSVLSILIFYIMRDKDAAKARKALKKGGTR
ncbi:MAG: ABC transporter permease subunit [Saccharofermentans sp.]|nr:ABC transporter permease subunit [Saccharofermentans sp.]